MTTIYPLSQLQQAIDDRGEQNLCIDPFSHTITVQTPTTPSTLIPLQQFRDRLTAEETRAILAAQLAGDVVIAQAVWLLTTQQDSMIDKTDSRVAQTLAYLVSKGLLAPDRPAQLIA